MRPSWVPGAAGSGYDADNLPFGVFAVDGDAPRVGARIGEQVLDLAPLAATDRPELLHAFEATVLNPLLALGRPTWVSVRGWLRDALTDEQRREAVAPHLVPLSRVSLHMPFSVADYVDFYSSLHHATNVGRLLRPDTDPLPPSWRHLPIGYHGRSGTVVVSGTPVRRPHGQRKPRHEHLPSYGASRRLDIEAELGFVVGTPTALGTQVGTERFEDHVFGVLLLNDWSARDLQAFEYVPLGPFTGKSFATSVSAWVTPLAALEPARVELPGQDPEPLPYLHVTGPAGYDIDLEVELNGEVVSRPPYRTTYWSPAQMLAHLTVNGASLRVGDLYASGTVSGPEKDQRGSFLELSWGGTEPFLVAGEERRFLEDGDTVVIRATAPGAVGPVALGEVAGTIMPAE